MTYFTPTHIATATGLTARTVRTYLRERFPRHESDTWWRLDAREYDIIVRELRSAQRVSLKQPRRILKKVLNLKRSI
jgi:hypothetical protein